MKNLKSVAYLICFVVLCLIDLKGVHADNIVKVALNYPESGPFSREGTDQYRGAELARTEINKNGGISGKKVEFRIYDSQSKPEIGRKNVLDAIEKSKVSMVFGGCSSATTFAVSKVCQEKQVLYFPTLTYSNQTTAEKGHRCLFRECYDSTMTARAISAYLKSKYGGKKFFYIVADNPTGKAIEGMIRKYSGTEDQNLHPCVRTPFPNPGGYGDALKKADNANADVLIFGLFGEKMATAIREAQEMGLKEKMAIIVPNLDIVVAERCTPKALEGAIGTIPWFYGVPEKYNYQRGINFVNAFVKRYNRYPGTGAASAYTTLYEYKDAVERAGTFDFQAVVKALEGHKFALLKGEQVWRDFDHQNLQTVYIVKCKDESTVLKDKYHMDYFEILDSISGESTAISRQDWIAVRKKAELPSYLERFVGE